MVAPVLIMSVSAQQDIPEIAAKLVGQMQLWVHTIAAGQIANLQSLVLIHG